jgi:hypothetical protein
LGRKLWVCGIWSHDQKEPSIHRIKRNNGYSGMLNKLERLIRGLRKKHGRNVSFICVSRHLTLGIGCAAG